jgi:beta-lactamase regulating signal transducer with metallopeptidase domain
MIGPTSWFPMTATQSLAWALLHFVWQGTVVAASAGIVMAFCRRAAVRYVVAVAALALVLVAPISTFFLLMASERDVSTRSSPVAAQTMDTELTGPRPPSRFPPSPSPSIALFWLVEAWLAGVAFFSLRSAGGFFILDRQRRRETTAPSARVLALCHLLQARLGLDRAIRFCVCRWLQAPAVIGWFRPVVLLPVTALTGLSEEQLQLVIAHELAHIRRLDPFINLFQISVETLLFYHPAVWWLNKRIREEREHCCDDVAISLCGNRVEYARALTLMEEWRTAPAMAMAANRGPLSTRIFRVLGRNSSRPGRRVGLAGSVLCLITAVLSGNALLGITAGNAVLRVAAISQAQTSIGEPARTAADSQQPASSSNSTAATKPSPARPAIQAQSGTTVSTSYIDGLKAAGLSDLTADQLIALKIQDVTPEYVRGMHQQGLQLHANTLVALRIQGADPEYVRDLHSLGLNPNADQIIAMKIQGVDPDYVRGLNEAGVQSDVDQLIAFKIHDVTSAYVRELHKLGLEFDADKLIAMRIQTVTPEYVREIDSLGFKPTADQFIAMRIQDITPDYVRSLQSERLEFDVDDLIAAKIQGINQEFVDKAVNHGFRNLTLQKLIRLKQMRILETRGEI